MPDNWGFVAAAYGLTAFVLGLYWRHLVRKEKELHSKTAASSCVVAGTARAHMERSGSSSSSDHEIAERSRPPSGPAHRRNVIAQHPERRPYTCSLRQFDAGLDAAVFELKFPLCDQPG